VTGKGGTRKDQFLFLLVGSSSGDEKVWGQVGMRGRKTYLRDIVMNFSRRRKGKGAEKGGRKANRMAKCED